MIDRREEEKGNGREREGEGGRGRNKRTGQMGESSATHGSRREIKASVGEGRGGRGRNG